MKKIFTYLAVSIFFSFGSVNAIEHFCPNNSAWDEEEEICRCLDWTPVNLEIWCLEENNIIWDSSGTISEALIKFADFLIYILLTLSVFFLIYAWILYATSMWDDEKIAKSKRFFIYVLVADFLLIFWKILISNFMTMMN